MKSSHDVHPEDATRSRSLGPALGRNGDLGVAGQVHTAQDHDSPAGIDEVPPLKRQSPALETGGHQEAMSATVTIEASAGRSLEVGVVVSQAQVSAWEALRGPRGPRDPE